MAIHYEAQMIAVDGIVGAEFNECIFEDGTQFARLEDREQTLESFMSLGCCVNKVAKHSEELDGKRTNTSVGSWTGKAHTHLWNLRQFGCRGQA